MEWKNPYAQKTAFDEIIVNEEKLVEVIFSLLDTYDSRTKLIKRQMGKGMADIKETLDTNIVDRTTHMRQTANIIAKMCSRLGLNPIIATLGMMGHDSGHPGGSHDGEETLTIIGILLNTGYFNHPSKGVEIIKSENFINKLVYAIINCIDDPEERKQKENDPVFIQRLKEDAWYILDVVASHDGEATSQEIRQQLRENKSNGKQKPKDAVRKKSLRSNSANLSKCAPETLEAALAKPADVIAYLKTDIENAFRRGIIKGFSDEYLETIGALLFEKDEEKLEKKEKIKKAEEHIRQIKIDCLRETEEDVHNPQNKEILKEIASTIKELEEMGIKDYSPKQDLEKAKIAEAIINRHKNKYMEKISKNMSLDSIAAEEHKFNDFMHKMLKARNSVVERLAEEVKQKLTDDYCENTKQKFEKIIKNSDIKEEDKKNKMLEAMGYSSRVSEIVNKLKVINYREYVQYAKKEYQANVLPRAMFKAIKFCSKAILNTGVIRDKCYDKGIIDLIKDENVKEAMKYAGTYKRIANYDEKKDFYKKEKRIRRYKRKIGINEFNYDKKNGKREYLKKKRKSARNLLYKDIYANTQRMGERFAIICEDVYNAIPNTVRELVKKAVSSSYTENHYLPKEERRIIKRTKKEIIKRKITPDTLEQYINDKIYYERTVNFSKNVASAIAIGYIGRLWK